MFAHHPWIRAMIGISEFIFVRLVLIFLSFLAEIHSLLLFRFLLRKLIKISIEKRFKEFDLNFKKFNQ
jgi:hypothetical protein